MTSLVSPKAYFYIDNQPVFEPYPLNAALALFEWGLNWCIAMRAHRYFLLHSAVVEKNGKAIILPANPGSGKSTLCAALIHRGWRLFSDEFGIIRPETGLFVPMPRPIPLKNKSIDVLKDFAPDADFGPVFHKTRKGTVSHVRAPRLSVEKMHVEAAPFWIIFPRFLRGSELIFAELPKSYALLKLATNAFNYSVLGKEGFLLVRDIVRQCDCYNLIYGELEEVIARLDELVEAK